MLNYTYIFEECSMLTKIVEEPQVEDEEEEQT
jgi:hypothetical protein